MNKSDNPQIKSNTFGQGLSYCLGLFLAHSPAKDKTRHSPFDKPEHWFNAASDHLYDLQIPKKFPKELKAKLTTFVDKCIHFGHSFKAPFPTEKDIAWAIEEAKELLLLIDNFYGIRTCKAEFE